MKQSLLFLLILLAIQLRMVTAQQNSWIDNDHNPSCYEKCFYEKLIHGNPKGVGDDYDLKYHRFNWLVDPAVSYISGSVTSYFVVKTATFSHVKFELLSTLQINAIIYHGTSLTTYVHSGGVLDITLPVILSAGQLDSITVVYQGNPGAGSGFGSFVTSTHNSVPVLWTLSEPYGASDWWPCKNILCDKIDSIDVIITTPAAYRAASNGILVSETTIGPNKRYHWKHRYPIAAYLVAIAVTNYAVYTDLVPLGNDTLTMLNYVYPENLNTAMSGTAAQIPVMQLFCNLFGPYPFMKEKYGHAQFSWGGGMEHQTMSFVVNFDFDLCAHEMAHMWYGDKVTCASWHDIWVNEGFATYAQGLSTQYLKPAGWKNWKKSFINNITSLPDGSVYCPDTTSVSRIFDWRLSYQKGAMVLHMLRWLMGDSAFFAGMKGIIANPQLAYNYASITDIRHEFEIASGLNLTGFFNDWIYGEGYPIYDVNCYIHPNLVAEVVINQTQSHSSVSYFELPVPIRFKNNTHDTIITFNNTFSGQIFFANLGFIPDSVIFDPDLWLVCKVNSLVTNIVDQYDNHIITLTPNPVRDWLKIEWNKPVSGKVFIYKYTGELTGMYQSGYENSLKVNCENLVPGSYFVKIISPDKTYYGRFIKL